MTHTNSRKYLPSLLIAAFLTTAIPTLAEAAPQRARGEAKAKVGKNNGNANRNSGNRGNNNNNRNTNVKNTHVNNSHNNVNVDRDVNINVDNDRHGRGRYNDDYHPIATAAAVTATVAVTSAVVGAILQPNQMASNCVQVMNGNMAYMQCGNTWYQPQYQGSDVTYIVVNSPR